MTPWDSVHTVSFQGTTAGEYQVSAYGSQASVV